jgi:hypothetical protein
MLPTRSATWPVKAPLTEAPMPTAVPIMPWGQVEAVRVHVATAEMAAQVGVCGFARLGRGLINRPRMSARPAPDCRPRRTFLHLSYSYAPSYRRRS